MEIPKSKCIVSMPLDLLREIEHNSGMTVLGLRIIGGSCIAVIVSGLALIARFSTGACTCPGLPW